ncbi:MAG: WD40 repeat domain-containing protein, partial [Pirellulaceae bacterium]
LLLVRDAAGLAAWEVPPAESFRLRWYRADPTLSSLALHPAEQSVVCGRLVQGQTEIVELDTATGELLDVIASIPANLLSGISLSRDGSLLAVVDNAGRAKLFERPAVTHTWRPRSMAGLEDRATGVVCFSPQSDRLITSDSTKRCFLNWDLPGQLSPQEFGFHESEVMGCAFGNDDRLLSWGLGDTIQIWDVSNGILDRSVTLGWCP